MAVLMKVLVTCTLARALGPAARLRELLGRGGIHTMPCCYDGITARLVERAGFEVSFMTGFGVAASRGYADAGLVSYGEMQDSCRIVAGALERIPFIADGDTGYGNACNVQRTVRGYAQVGAAGVMIEDQVSPKRCGHTRVKAVVGRDEALARVRAACDARDAVAAATGQAPIVVVARTDANAVHGFEEAVERCRLFREAGADVTFLEAPTSVDEMAQYCARVSGWKLANMLEGGKTPILPPAQLADMGYTLAAYPLTLLSAGARQMTNVLDHLKAGEHVPDAALLPFGDLCDAVGFTDYFALAARYED